MMSDRCPYHDDLVIAVGQVLSKMDAMHEDIHEIKVDLYEQGNGGIMGWMNRRKGYRTAITFAVPIGFSAVTTIIVLVLNHLLRL
jgi:hypothetical protein